VADIDPTDSPDLTAMLNAVGFAERSVVDQFLEQFCAESAANGFLHHRVCVAAPRIEDGELVLHCSG
jgi:hypothetical protein